MLSALLARAEAGGTLARVLGERRFRDRRGGSVIVAGERLADGIVCTVTFRAEGAMREESLRTRHRLGWDGRVRDLELRLVRGRDRVEASGEVAGETLRLRLRETRGSEASERELELSWPPDAVPFDLAAFTLPRLADAGLPDALRLRVFHPATLSLNPGATTLRRQGADWLLEDLLPGQGPAVAQVEGGELRELRLGDADTLTAVAPEVPTDR